MLQVAQHWYETRKFSNELTLIYEPHVHPFLRCNIWHLKGRDKDLLIDTGLGVSSLKDAIADMIDKPVVALATHIHYDHVGCLHEFDERLMHSTEASRMSNYDEFSWLRVSDFPENFHEALTTEQYTDYLIKARPHKDFKVEDYRVQSTSITRQLEEGDVIDLGNRALTVFHLPGHSPGSIGLWDSQSATLFSGDALYDGELLDELPGSNIPDYINTMKRIRDLPVTTVHGGHEASFDRTRMVALIDAYLDWREN
jgi:glyoxylase-like metal-dependent hydrolase (beta-lactamase superfamily II)